MIPTRADSTYAPMAEGAYAFVLLTTVDVPGYGVFRRGDVATFEAAVSDALRAAKVAKRWREGMELPRPHPSTVVIGNYETRTVR